MTTKNARFLLLAMAATLSTVEGQAAIDETIPLDLQSAGGRPVVTLQLNGHPSQFIVDTGAPFGVIVAEHAEAVGARFVEKATLGSPLGGEPLPAERVEIGEVALGSVDLGSRTFTAIPSAAFPMPGGAVGVLPFSALSEHHTVVVDFAAATLSLQDSAPTAVHWSPLDRADGQMGVDLQVGEHSVPAHLDTGSPGMVLLPIKYASDFGLADDLTAVGQMRTVDAVREIMGAQFDGTVLLGGIELPVSTLRFADIPYANVGMQAFAGRQLVIERGTQRFALTELIKTPAASTPSGAQARVEALPVPLGLQLTPADGVLGVAGVGPGSRAERAGLLIGDNIVAINGHAVADIPMAELREHMVAQPLSFTVDRDGETLELAVPDR